MLAFWSAGASCSGLSSVRGLMSASFTSAQAPNLSDAASPTVVPGQATAVSNSGKTYAAPRGVPIPTTVVLLLHKQRCLLPSSTVFVPQWLRLLKECVSMNPHL